MSDELIPKRLGAIESAISTINAAIEDLGSRITQFSLNPFTSNNPLAVRAQSIATQHLKNLSVTNAKVNDLSAVKITTGTLDAARIAAGSITADKITVGILGGNNELQNSSFEDLTTPLNLWSLYNNGPESATLTAVATSYHGVTGARVSWTSTNTSTKGVLAAVTNITWKASTRYIVSWWAKSTSSIATGMNLYWNTAPSVQTALQNPNLSTTWQRYIYDITWGASVDPNLFISITSGFAAVGNDLYIDAIQAEQGQLATAYSPKADELLGGQVTGSYIADLAVSTAKIADLAVSTAKIAALAVTNAKINDLDAGKINAGLLTVSRLNITGIMMQGFTWTDNSPSAGKVAWSSGTLQYDGTTYSITSGDTGGTDTYIYWTKGTSNTTFRHSATRPTLGDDDFLIATNLAGLHDLAFNNTGGTASTSVFPAAMSFDTMASLFIYGDGNDGDVTISADTNLSRDMTYNSLTVNSAKILDTKGYRIFVKNTLTNNGTIRSNGATGLINGTAGAGAAAGTLGGGGQGGGGGGADTGGGNGAALANGLGLTGGAGGIGGTQNCTTTYGFGGAAGVNTITNANRHGLVLLSDSGNVKGGTGGGGGSGGPGGASGCTGGGGGGGGGVIVIAARTITNNSVIEAKGGAGGNGGPVTCNCNADGQSGGGGGGGGGAIVMVYRTATTGTLTVTGGAKGNKVCAGCSFSADGVAGSTGITLLIQQEA